MAKNMKSVKKQIEKITSKAGYLAQKGEKNNISKASYSTMEYKDLKKINFIINKIYNLRKSNNKKPITNKKIKIKNGTDVKSIIKLIKAINKEAENQKSFNTGLAGEKFLIASYKIMDFEALKKQKNIITRELQKRIELKRVSVNAGKIEKLIKGV